MSKWTTLLLEKERRCNGRDLAADILSLLTMVQKPKDVQRFLTLAKACLTCNAYEELDKMKCPVLVLGGACDKITTGEASVEIAKKQWILIKEYMNF